MFVKACADVCSTILQISQQFFQAFVSKIKTGLNETNLCVAPLPTIISRPFCSPSQITAVTSSDAHHRET